MTSNSESKGERKGGRSHSSSSRSRSRSKSRDRERSRRHRSATRSTFSRSPSPSASKRLHVANLDESVRRRDIEDTFGKYGKLSDVWVASYPPFYAFIVYERGEDAKEALKEMRSGYVRNCPVRTTIALPRNTGRRIPPPRRFYDDFDDRDRNRRRSRSRSPRRSRRSRSPRKNRRSRSNSR